MPSMCYPFSRYEGTFRFTPHYVSPIPANRRYELAGPCIGGEGLWSFADGSTYEGTMGEDGPAGSMSSDGAGGRITGRGRYIDASGEV